MIKFETFLTIFFLLQSTLAVKIVESTKLLSFIIFAETWLWSKIQVLLEMRL